MGRKVETKLQWLLCVNKTFGMPFETGMGEFPHYSKGNKERLRMCVQHLFTGISLQWHQASVVQVKIVGSDTEIFFEGGIYIFSILANMRKNTYIKLQE